MPYIPTAAEISGDGLDVMQWMAPSCAWNRLFDFCPTADEHAFYTGKVVAFHLMAHMDHQDTPGSYLGRHRHFADHRVAYVMLELSCTHKLDVRVSAQSTSSDMAWISLDHPHIRYAPGFATFDDCNYHRSKLWWLSHMSFHLQFAQHDFFNVLDLLKRLRKEFGHEFDSFVSLMRSFDGR
tara:strand:+ start:2822 stop:3364 length:543 start_codon:yes stop_codon:yes gene_type:complete